MYHIWYQFQSLHFICNLTVTNRCKAQLREFLYLTAWKFQKAKAWDVLQKQCKLPKLILLNFKCISAHNSTKNSPAGSLYPSTVTGNLKSEWSFDNLLIHHKHDRFCMINFSKLVYCRVFIWCGHKRFRPAPVNSVYVYVCLRLFQLHNFRPHAEYSSLAGSLILPAASGQNHGSIFWGTSQLRIFQSVLNLGGKLNSISNSQLSPLKHSS